MKETGLFRICFLGLVLCSSVATAYPSAPIDPRAQKSKPSDTIVELTHILGGSVLGNSVRGESPAIQGGIKITGPASRLADFHQITSSWTLFECKPSDQGSQVVLAYCGETNVSNCLSIFVGGVSDTIVKLPDGCGRSPFAHVVSFIPKTKQLPLSLRKQIGKEKVSVYELTFDYNFAAIQYNHGKEVPTTIHIEFSNVDGYIDNPDFGKKRSYDAWLSGIKGSHGYGRDLWTKEGHGTKPICESFSLTLATLSKQCEGFDMSLSIDAAGKVKGFADYGYYVTGSVIPPKINEHFVYLNGKFYVRSTLSLAGLVDYTFPTLTVPIIPVIGMPGLDYPGLLTLGPFFEMNAILEGSISLDGSVSMNTGFTIPSVEISIGNGTAPQTSSRGVEFADVTFDDNLELGAKLSLTLAPQLGMGVKVLSGLVDATVTLTPSAELTASGDLNFEPSTGKITNPCLGLNGDLALDWDVSGNVGSWGEAKTGEIWSMEKKLWEKCFKVPKAKRDIIPAANHTNGFDQVSNVTCPVSNPFTKSPKA